MNMPRVSKTGLAVWWLHLFATYNLKASQFAPQFVLVQHGSHEWQKIVNSSIAHSNITGYTTIKLCSCFPVPFKGCACLTLLIQIWTLLDIAKNFCSFLVYAFTNQNKAQGNLGYKFENSILPDFSFDLMKNIQHALIVVSCWEERTLTQCTDIQRAIALARILFGKISGRRSPGTGPAPNENDRTYLAKKKVQL